MLAPIALIAVVTCIYLSYRKEKALINNIIIQFNISEGDVI
jgi:hypothetical protein